MKEQKTDESRREIGSEVEAPAKGERKRASDGDGEPGVVRIRLPTAVGIKVKEVVAELRARGAQVTLDELLSEYVEAIPERYFETQLLQRTPEPYYLDAAAKVPELREMLIRQAKKGLMKASARESYPRKQRKLRRKAGEAAAMPQEISANGTGE